MYVSTIWTRLFFVFWDDGPFSQEVLQAGAMATKGIIRRHEPEGQVFFFKQKLLQQKKFKLIGHFL